MRALLLLGLIQAIVSQTYKTSPEFVDPSNVQLLQYRNQHRENIPLVTGYGTPIDSIDSTLSAGKIGPLLIQDIVFFERLAHFARERIPERLVHAKGTGAFGTFTVTNDVSKYTNALFVSEVGKKTNVAVRFSTSTGSKGSPDTVRDLRGFAVKFYTEDGILDLMTLATPTFFIRDPMLFPQLTHSLKPNPVTNMKDYNSFWDFMTQRPQTMLQIVYLFGEDGIPDCYRCINGFAANTYKLRNDDGDVYLAKFQLKTPLNCQGMSNERASNLSATDPDFCSRDLYNSIARKDYPKWTFGIQVMTEEESTKLSFNPFDVTKLWQEEQFPFIPIGELVLDRNPTNFFEQVEAIGFNPGKLVPGIEVSLDKVLQGRMFIYGDTQRYRIGPNFEQMRINQPGNLRVTNYDRDGPQVFENQASAPNYYPNRFSGPQPSSRGKIGTYNITGAIARYPDYDDDNYSEPTRIYRSLSRDKKQMLLENLACDIKKTLPEIQKRAVEVFSNIGDLGAKLKKALLDDNYPFTYCSPN